MEITKETDVDVLGEYLQSPPPHRLPEAWWSWDNVHEAHRRLARQAIAGVPAYPGGYRGRGIVVGGGGHRLFTNAYVCIRMLRHLGCRLPIQLWHYEGEVDGAMRRIVAPLGVECVDADGVERALVGRFRPLKKGWELKPFAILHCPFREVLLLDADNVPVLDPAFLFDTPEFREAGAIFWPDYGRLAPWRHIWAVCEVPYRDEPEVESGQVVVDKRRCWEALNLTAYYNDYSEFYYEYMHGDKETFHMAFRRVGWPYAMPGHAIHPLEHTMCQHDFGGRRLFQHRNMDKWKFDGSNRAIVGFWYEDLCRSFLAELRRCWSGRIFQAADPDPDAELVRSRLSGRLLRYTRVGYDERPLRLCEAGFIGEGAADAERHWAVNKVDGEVVLTIIGSDSPTCHLRLEGGAWRGRWLHHERMPIELREIEERAAQDISPTVADCRGPL